MAVHRLQLGSPTDRPVHVIFIYGNLRSKRFKDKPYVCSESKKKISAWKFAGFPKNNYSA
jgi:hypothetical protein